MKKVWPIALAAAAIFFTTGAALGYIGMSWGKVAATLVTKVGIKGTLGKVLTGSIAGSGWGAAIGGGVSAAAGGSFTEGARSGALSGAITGGLAGAAGWTPGVKPTSASNTANLPLEYHDFGKPLSGLEYSDFGPQNLVNTVVKSGEGAKGGGNSLIGFLKGTGKWVEKNPVVAGNLISGVGKGIGTAAAARTQADMATEERQAFDDRLAQISDNYRVSREALGLPPLELPTQQVAVPDVTQAAQVDPLRVSNAGSPAAEEMLRSAAPNSLLAQELRRRRRV